MSAAQRKEVFNFNTILITIVIALCTASIKKTYDTGETVSALSVQVKNLERVVFDNSFRNNQNQNLQPTGKLE